jgi:hypothetical protein
MFGVIKLQSSGNGLRTEGLQNAGGRRETIELKCAQLDHFNEHAGWYSVKQDQVVISTANLFLGHANVPLNFGHMFIIGHGVERNLEDRQFS